MIWEMDVTPLYLEDLRIGQEFVSRKHQMDADQIISYARQFDPQPFHLDPEKAEESIFEGLVASGWHTMAISVKLMVESVPFAKGLAGAGGEVTWPRPTRPGDVLHLRTKVQEIRPSRSKPDRGIVLLRALSISQDGHIHQDFTAKTLAFSKHRN